MFHAIEYCSEESVVICSVAAENHFVVLTLAGTIMATQSSDNLTRFALSGLSNMCGGAGEMRVFLDYFPGCMSRFDFEINKARNPVKAFVYWHEFG